MVIELRYLFSLTHLTEQIIKYRITLRTVLIKWNFSLDKKLNSSERTIADEEEDGMVH